MVETSAHFDETKYNQERRLFIGFIQILSLVVIMYCIF